MKLISLLSFLAILSLVQSTSVHILDQDGESISSIAEQVCRYTKGRNRQISKISTVARIADYLGTLPADDKLAACSKFHLHFIRDLSSLISISNDNVCSEQKISAIQQYHRGYILKGSRSTHKAPKIIATFFYHYVNSVNEICAAESAKFLSILENTSNTETGEVDELLGEFSAKMGGSSSSILQYRNIFLIWSLVDMLPARNHHKIQKYLFEGEKRVVFSAKNSEPFNKMQEFCITNARPLYSHSLLSTIKLIDMGYYPSNPAFLEQLNSNKQARRFYELTRVCEALLPVRLVEQVEGQTLDSDIAILSRDEIEKLGLSEVTSTPENTGELCNRCSMEVDSIPSINDSHAMEVATGIHRDIKSRKGAIARLIKACLSSVKSNIAGSMKKLFGSEEGEDIENLDLNQLDIYEVSEEDEAGANSLRSKRNVFSTMAYNLGKIAFVPLFVLWVFAKYLIFRPLYYVYKLISWFTGVKSRPVAAFFWSGGFSLHQKDYFLSRDRE